MNTCNRISEEITEYIEENYNNIINAFVSVYGEKHRKTIEEKLSRVRLIYTYNFPKLKKIEIEYLIDEKMRIVKEALSICSLETGVMMNRGRIKVDNTKLEELFMKLYLSLSIIPTENKSVINTRMIKGILRKNHLEISNKKIEELVDYFNEEHRKFFENEGIDYIDLLNILQEGRKEEIVNPNKFIGLLGSNIPLNDKDRFIITFLMEDANKSLSKRDKKEGKITYNMSYATAIEEKDLAMFNPFDFDAELDLIHELGHLVSTSHLMNTSEGIISKVGLEIDRKNPSEFEIKESFVSELIEELIAIDVMKHLPNFKIPTPRYTDTVYSNMRELNILKEFYNRYKPLILEAYISENKNILVNGIGKDNYRDFIELIYESRRKREEDVLLNQAYLINDIDRSSRIFLEESEKYALTFKKN